MPTPTEILQLNLAATRFRDLTVDARLTTSHPQPSTKNMRILSKWQPTVGSGTLYVMGRTDPAYLFDSFLIQQTLHKPPSSSIQLWTATNGKTRHVAFVPWDTLPQTEIRNVDQVIPHPATFTATFSPPGTAPQGPGAMPSQPCFLIDMQFPPPGPGDPRADLARLWIEQSPRAVHHRIEQYRGNVLLRVIVPEGWARLGPGTPWGAPKTTFIDAQSLRSTTLTIVSQPDPRPMPPSTFTVGNLISGLW
jgi:hypothetical protein